MEIAGGINLLGPKNPTGDARFEKIGSVITVMSLFFITKVE